MLLEEGPRKPIQKPTVPSTAPQPSIMQTITATIKANKNHWKQTKNDQELKHQGWHIGTDVLICRVRNVSWLSSMLSNSSPARLKRETYEAITIITLIGSLAMIMMKKERAGPNAVSAHPKKVNTVMMICSEKPKWVLRIPRKPPATS